MSSDSVEVLPRSSTTQKKHVLSMSNKIQTCSKNDFQNGPKKRSGFGGGAKGDTFGGPILFLTLKVSPQRFKSASNEKTDIENDTQDPQYCKSEPQSGRADCAKRFN